MGLFKDTKKIVTDANQTVKERKQEDKIKKKVEKDSQRFQMKRDEEIQKLKSAQAHQTSIKNSGQYRAYVVLNLVNGTLSEEIAVLGAEIGYKNEEPVLRVKDREGTILFEEPKPDSTEEFEYYDAEILDQQIQKCKDSIKDIQSGKKKMVDNFYEADWIHQLRMLQAKRAHVTLGLKGSYMKIRDGVPHYEFDLIGFFKVPVFRYASTSSIAIPPLEKIITGQILIKKINEEIRADEKDAAKILNGIFTIILIICILAAMFFMYKSGITDVEISKNLATTSINLKELVEYGPKLDNIQSTIDSLNSTVSQSKTTPVRSVVGSVK